MHAQDTRAKFRAHHFPRGAVARTVVLIALAVAAAACAERAERSFTYRGMSAGMTLQDLRVAAAGTGGIECRPGNIVGAIANEADLESRYIGRIDIRDAFTLVDLPDGMPADLLCYTPDTSGSALRIAAAVNSGDSTVPYVTIREALTAPEVLDRLDKAGASRYVVTDITKDGTMRGPNLDLLREVCARTSAPVVASGGVSTLDDLRALAALEPLGVEGVIAGKALYAGAFTVAEALEVLRGA